MCLSVCVCPSAVKFGRMSKKQRERVEDEANFHKRRLNDMTTTTMMSGTSEDADQPLRLTNNNNNGHADNNQHLNRLSV